MGKAVIFAGSTVKALQQNLDLNGIASILTGTDDPTVVAKNAPQGSLYTRTGASGGSLYEKQDAGSSTNWSKLSLTGTMPSSNTASTSTVTSATTTFVTAITTTITITNTCPIWAVATATLTTTTAASVANTKIVINGVSGQTQLLSLTAIATDYTSAVQFISANIAPGTYTVTYQIARSSGTGTVNFTQGTLDVIGLQGASTVGITQLTGALQAGPGTGSVALTGTLPVTNGGTGLAATTINQILYSSATNTVAGLATTNTGALVTSSSGVPSVTSGSTANRLLRTNGTTVSFAQAALATDVSGTLPAANGGTGFGNWVAGRIPYGTGTSLAADPNLQWDNTNKSLNVGGGGGVAAVNAIQGAGGTHAALNSYQYGSNNNSQFVSQNNNYDVSMAKFSGTNTLGVLIGGQFGRGNIAAPAQSLNGDILMTFAAAGTLSTGVVANGFSAAMGVVATEAPTATANGGDLTLATAVNGTTAIIERVRVKNSGETQLTNSHFKSIQATPPTVSVNANAGTGATSSVSNATDNAGVLSLTTGTLATSAGIQTTVNFNVAYNVAPIVQITPQDANSALNIVARGIYVTSTTAGFSINFSVAETVGTAYTWFYQVIETQ